MAFTRRRLAVCVVGAMCASAPPAEGFTPPGCLAPLPGAGDSFHCAERRLAAATAGGGPAQGGDHERRAAAARFSMASSSRIAPAGPRVAARSGAAKAAAAVARKRGRNRKPPPPAKGGGSPDRYEAAVAANGGRTADGQQLQQHPKLLGEEPRATATAAAAAAVANPPPAKGFRRKGNNINKKRVAAASVARQQQQQLPRGGPGSLAAAAAAAGAAGAATTPPPPPSSSSADSLTAYFKTLKKIKMLKPDEEVVLGRRIQRGLQLERVRDRLESSKGAAPTDEEWASSLNLTRDEMLRELAAADRAKKHMISANLRLVVSMARNYQFRGLELPDLIQEGTMGLVKATEKFNPEMGFKFYTYATWWVKQSLLTGIANQSRVIRLPTKVHAFLSSIRKYTHELTVDGKLPTDEELGDKLGATVQKIQHYRKAALNTDSLSLESRLGGGGKKKSDDAAAGLGDLGDNIGDTKNPEPEDASQTFYMKGKVTALLATLKEKERKVVRARYGLDGATAKTLEQIGREMGLTRERVRQIETKALSKLRQPYRNYRVREHQTGQIFVDAGLRAPTSEAVSAARVLIAEAEGLEKQQLAAASGGWGQPAVAAAGDRPLRIEFKPGVDASESTQAVEAVLVAALDRTPATAAVSTPGGGVGSGRRKQPSLREKAESPLSEGRVVAAGSPQAAATDGVLAEPSSLVWGAPPSSSGEAAAEGLVPGDQPSPPPPAEPVDGGGRSAEGLDVPGGGVTLTPDSRRLLLDIESQQTAAGPAGPEVGPGPEFSRVNANRLVVARGSDELSDAAASASERGGGGGGGGVSGPGFAPVEPLVVGVGPGVDLPAAAALSAEEQRALDIESKRKSLDKAWNKKSEAAVDRLERELAQSAAALAALEIEQEEWERSVGDVVVVEQKSLSMASL